MKVNFIFNCYSWKIDVDNILNNFDLSLDVKLQWDVYMLRRLFEVIYYSCSSLAVISRVLFLLLVLIGLGTHESMHSLI